MNIDAKTANEEYSLPCAEALLAGTLALMTGHVQACCDRQRGLMGLKITDNLSRLAAHPRLTPQFRTMLWNLRARWQLQLQQHGDVAPSEPDRRLWHRESSSVQ
ncbi:MAG: hypothetical protein NDJ19_01835 [Ramlibacter sp.]|nr:hypothetical protein [Ramlibacter sp.]